MTHIRQTFALFCTAVLAVVCTAAHAQTALPSPKPGQILWTKDFSDIRFDLQLHLTPDEQTIVSGIEGKTAGTPIPLRIEIATLKSSSDATASESAKSDIRKLLGTEVVLQNGNSIVLAFPQGNPPSTEVGAFGPHPWSTLIVEGPGHVIGTAVDSLIGIVLAGQSRGEGEQRVVSVDGLTGLQRHRKIGNWPPQKFGSDFIGFALPGYAVAQSPITESSITIVDATSLVITETFGWSPDWKLFRWPQNSKYIPMVSTSGGLIVLSGYSKPKGSDIVQGGLIVVDSRRRAPPRFLNISPEAMPRVFVTGMALGRDGVVYFSFSNRSILTPQGGIWPIVSGGVRGIKVETGETILISDILGGVESPPLITKTGTLIACTSSGYGYDGKGSIVGIATSALGGLAQTPWPRSTGDNQNSWREQSVSDDGGSTSTTPPSDPVGQQCSGLFGEYFSGRTFDVFRFARLDHTIDFQWLVDGIPAGSPDPSIEPIDYSIRWTGYVTPQFSETYTFSTLSDDGIRLWIDNRILINNWSLHGRTTDSGTISLVAGVPYRIRLEYFQGPLYGAEMRLFWSSPSQLKEIIPPTRLSCSGNSPPSISIVQPSNLQLFPIGTNITIIAKAADAEGSVAAVEFFEGATNRIGVSMTTPFSMVLSNALAGSYRLSAKAVDKDGLTSLSAPVDITVVPSNLAPSITITSPLNGAVFESDVNILVNTIATDPDGRIAKVEVYDSERKLGEIASAPFSLTWNNVTSGSYTLTARAFDDLGASSNSDPVSITVNNKPVLLPPTVTIVSPKDGSVYSADSDVTITATAKDADGSVSLVEFISGTTSLGIATSEPFTLTWRNVKEGKYVLTAKAIDSTGIMAMSAPVDISVQNVTGDVAVLHSLDDVEIGQLQDFLLEMGLKPVLFSRSTVSAEVLKRFQLVIYDDQGEAERMLTESEVDAMEGTFKAGIPLLFIGERLASANANLDAAHQQRWGSLTHLQGSFGRSSIEHVTVPDSQDLHPFLNGAYGKPGDFNYVGLLDQTVVIPNSTAEAIVSTSQVDLFVIAPALSAVDDTSTRTVAQSFLLSTRGNDAVDPSRKALFQNTVCWLLRICPPCTAGHAAGIVLENFLSSQFVNVGEHVTNSIKLEVNGECNANGVVVTNVLPKNLRFVSATAPQGAWIERGGVVTFFLGNVPRASVVEMTVTALASVPGTVAITSCARMNQQEFVAADRCEEVTVAINGGVAPILLIEVGIVGSRVWLIGGIGVEYAIEANSDLGNQDGWKEVNRVSGGASRIDISEPMVRGSSTRFYRARVVQ